MAKKKIVVKVTMNTEKKIRKALKIVVSITGVVTLLSKGVGYTELLSVGPVEEQKPAAHNETNPTVELLHVNPYEYYYGSYGMPYYEWI